MLIPSRVALRWEKGNVRARVSNDALQGGKDSDGSMIYVGRAFHNGVYLPAKVIPSKNACYVSEFQSNQFNSTIIEADN